VISHTLALLPLYLILSVWCEEIKIALLFSSSSKKLLSYTLVGFDLTTHDLCSLQAEMIPLGYATRLLNIVLQF
jgi:hypothetical protein